MVGSVFFILGLIAIIVGAIFIDVWVSWLVVIVGVILQALGKNVLSSRSNWKNRRNYSETLIFSIIYSGNNSEEENKYIQD